MSPAIDELLKKVSEQLDALKVTRLNFEIKDFALPTPAQVEEWIEKLQKSPAFLIVERATEVRDSIRLPEGLDKQSYEHLTIYVTLYEIRETLQKLIQQATDEGYRHPVQVVASGENFAPQITDIRNDIAVIDKKLNTLLKKSATSGFTLTFGILSVPFDGVLDAIKATKRLLTNESETDVGALSSTLATMDHSMNGIVRKVSSYIDGAQDSIFQALRDVARRISDVARKGYELLDRVIQLQSLSASMGFAKPAALEGEGSKRIFRGLTDYLAISLGSANTVIYSTDDGVILNEPTLIALENINGTHFVRAIGNEAKRMVGRTPGNIEAIRPLRGGLITDTDLIIVLVSRFLAKAYKARRISKLAAIVTVPTGSPEIVRDATEAAIVDAGARRCVIMEKASAAAVGADMPIFDSRASTVINFGAGRTEIVVFSLGGVVYSRSIAIAGDALDEAIVSYMRRHSFLAIGDLSAEMVKLTIGCAGQPDESMRVEIKGRDLRTGAPKRIMVNQKQIHDAISEQLLGIYDAVSLAIESVTADLMSDIIDNGIVLTGGGALLPGLANALQMRFQFPVTIAKNPTLCAARGAGRVLIDEARYHHILAMDKKDLDAD